MVEAINGPRASQTGLDMGSQHGGPSGPPDVSAPDKTVSAVQPAAPIAPAGQEIASPAAANVPIPNAMPGVAGSFIAVAGNIALAGQSFLAAPTVGQNQIAATGGGRFAAAATSGEVPPVASPLGASADWVSAAFLSV